MGAGNMGGAAGRDLSRRMREQQGDDRDPNAMGGFRNTPLRQEERRPAAGVQDERDVMGGGRGGFQFGGAEEGLTRATTPGFGEEADLSAPGVDSPDPDAVRAVASSNKKRMRERTGRRQAKFLEQRNETNNGSDETRNGVTFGAGFASRGEQMPGEGVGQPRMQPAPGPDVKPPGGYQGGFDFEAMMGGPKQQAEEEIQSRQPVPGQALQAGQQAFQIREALTARRGAAGKRKMPSIDEDYFSI